MVRRLAIYLVTVLLVNSGWGNVGGQVAGATERGHTAVCQRSERLVAGCGLQVVTGLAGRPLVTSGPSGYGPDTFRGAYGLSGANSSGTIAIVSAYSQPHLLQDLNTYNAAFGLPATPACTQKPQSACLAQMNQRGGSVLPAVNASWGLETSLDTEVAHGICPSCRILVVEADSASLSDLFAAVDQAVIQGARVVSNSYGTGEFFYESQYDWHFNKPGVMFVFASGDSGYGTGYPAASPYVTAAGGTSLVVGSGQTRQSEKAWSGSGSGCSRYERKPSWQHDSGCTRRTIADVSAVADPATGAAVYDSLPYGGQSGWYVLGGTSLAAPIVASAYVMAGGASGIGASALYSKVSSSNTYDISSGTNGRCSILSPYLCSAMAGYDGPTGWGSPSGTGAY